MAAPEPDTPPPKAFISYSWDDDAHKEWVKQLATRLRADGVNVTLDRWHSEPGDQIPAFMERAVRENDFVIAICTPRFKERSDERGGGVGYEGDIMTAYAFTGGDKRKFIPVLRRGKWTEAAPTWLLGRAKIDLSGNPYSESEYEELLRTLYGAREEAPPIGRRPKFEDNKRLHAGPAPPSVSTFVESSPPQHQSSLTPIAGHLPIPGVKEPPLPILAAVSVAVVVIVMLISYFVYIYKPSSPNPPYKPEVEVSSGITTGWEQMEVDLIGELEADKNREGEIDTLRDVLNAMSAAAKEETRGEKESLVYSYSSKPFLKDAVQFSARAELGAVRYDCIQTRAYIRRAGSAEVVRHEVTQNNALVVSVPAAGAGSRLAVLIRLCGAKGRLPFPGIIHWTVDK